MWMGRAHALLPRIPRSVLQEKRPHLTPEERTRVAGAAREDWDVMHNQLPLHTRKRQPMCTMQSCVGAT